MNVSPNPRTRADTLSKKGYVMLYVLGLLTLLGFYGVITLGSTAREAQAALHHVRETQAYYHAESGARMVQAEVESRLAMGQDLATALTSLSVSAPTGFEFDTITTFEVVVTGKMFRFNSVGRSGEAEAILEVHYRVGDPLFKAGIYGIIDLSSQPNVSIYGYDSQVLETTPTPSDSNGRATIGSNQMVSLGNNFSLDGAIILGADADGNTASTQRADSLTQEQVGHLEPDPMGANGGALADTFTRVSASNDNSNVSAIVGNTLALKPGDTVTIPSGEYYFTDLYTPPNVTVILDDTDGPVYFYIDGEVDFQPSALTQDSDAYNFQLYSISDETIRVQPRGDFSAFIYAPNTTVELWPNGDFRGGIWSDMVQMQPGGDIYVDTSLQDRFLSPDLTVHAWFERRRN